MPTPTTNPTVLPGHVLGKFRTKQFRMAEDFYAQRALQQAAAGAVGQAPLISERIMATTNAAIANGTYSYGSQGFRIQSMLPTSLPFLLWLSLSVENAKVGQADAESLITEENENALILAVNELMGFTPPNVQAAAAKSAPPNPPTTSSQEPSLGTTSSDPSAPKDSSTTPSNA